MTMKSILYSILPFFPIVFYISLDLVIVELIVLALTVLIMIICVYGLKIQIVPIKVHNVLHVVAIPMVIVWLGMNWVNDNDNIQTVEIENNIQTISESDEPISEPELMYDVSSNNKAPIVNVNAYENKDDKLMKQGVWYDKTTGLYWDRCSVGQTWDGETCQGEPLELNWYDAQDYVAKFTNEKTKGGFTDWRVPTIEELSSIRYCSDGWANSSQSGFGEQELTAQGLVGLITIVADSGTKKLPSACSKNSKNPTIHNRLFVVSSGYFDSSVYWSSSASTDFQFSAWTAGFKGGAEITTYNKYGSFYVRAVRSD